MAWDDLRLRVLNRMAGIVERKGEGRVDKVACLLFSLYNLISHVSHQHNPPITPPPPPPPLQLSLSPPHFQQTFIPPSTDNYNCTIQPHLTFIHPPLNATTHLNHP